MLSTLETWARRVWAERDPIAIHELSASDIRMHGLGPQPLVGPDAYQAFHQQVCHLFVETRLVVHNHLEQGEWLAARCTFVGRTADGREASAEGAVFARIADGKVLEGYNYFDLIGMFTQLGQLPADTLECCMNGQGVGGNG
ncbi:ester cyclase [Geminicoccus roseus]|uniref:ester cyclase n=1 Tax=Geminicoccus roseus TaxID=404900 RepID=UPI00041F8AAD|nr:ester cyclase [Geminicoccus roseus]